MDPATAFGLASSIVQFVTFAASLLKQTFNIHGSIDGHSGWASALDDNYKTLIDFSVRLEGHLHDGGQAIHPTQRDIQHDLAALTDLSIKCKVHCRVLLDILQELKVGPGPWKGVRSLKAAIKTLCKTGQITDIESQLESIQMQMTLHLCHISNHYHGRHETTLAHVLKQTERLETSHTEKLDQIKSTLDNIQTVLSEHGRGNSLASPEVENLHRMFSGLSITQKDMSRDLAFLQSLTFDQHVDRYRSILGAHKDTLRWVVKAESKGQQLLTWFREGQGVFWVTGKPGSGKSTLMKFIVDNPRTMKLLKQWAGPSHQIVIASHYFWYAGTPMQKSHEGLLRVLLYGIFKQCPNLIQEICRSRWDQAEAATVWSLEELQGVVQSLASHPPAHLKFCLFIDGLDEYAGDHEEIAKILNDLAASSRSIKLCISSRPWNEFNMTFGRSTERLVLHELTENDIRAYTTSRLSNHQMWNVVSARNPQTKSLIQLIVERAEGVFLWVFLVTNLLRNGLSNHDSITDLYRRVESFPPDLERFFTQTLESVDPFYHKKMSAALNMALHAPEPQNLSVYAFLEQECEDPSYALSSSPPVEKDVHQQHEDMKYRLNGWCKGLLEVHGENVHVLHQTVADFFKTAKMTRFLDDKIPSGFSVRLSLVKACLALVKTGVFQKVYTPKPGGSLKLPTILGPRPSYLPHMMENMLSVASDLDNTDYLDPAVHDAMCKHLDDFEATIQDRHKKGMIKFKGGGQDISLRVYYRRMLVQQGHMPNYLIKKLRREPDYLQGLLEPAIAILLRKLFNGHNARNDFNRAQVCRQYKATIRCLLENGYNPNEVYYAQNQTYSHHRDTFDYVHNQEVYQRTPFTSLSWYSTGSNELSKIGVKLSQHTTSIMHMGLFSLFLEFGATPMAPLDGSERLKTDMFSTVWGNFLLLAFEIPWDSDDQEAYLKELDAFLHCPGSLLQMRLFYQTSQPSRMVVGKSLKVHEVFFNRLRASSSVISTRPVRSMFLGKVCQRLCQRMYDEGIEIQQSVKVIDELFPPVARDHIHQQVENYIALSRGKRREKKRKKELQHGEDVDEGESSKKRRVEMDR